MYNSLSPTEVEEVQNIRFSKEATDKIEGRQKVRQRAGKNQVRHRVTRTAYDLIGYSYMSISLVVCFCFAAASLAGGRSGVAVVDDGARRNRKHPRPESVPRGELTATPLK